jgi:hypothetical protein
LGSWGGGVNGLGGREAFDGPESVKGLDNFLGVGQDGDWVGNKFLVAKENGKAAVGCSYATELHFDNRLTHTASLYSFSRQDPHYCSHR